MRSPSASLRRGRDRRLKRRSIGRGPKIGRLNSGPANAPTVSGPVFVPTLHGIRGLAVLAVVLYHVAGAGFWTPGGGVPRALYESGGPLAVDVLFFTSGFVLFLPVVCRGSFGSTRAFAIRRFARLGPPYYVCMLLVLAFFPLFSTPAIANAAERGFSDILVHISFLQRLVSPRDPGFIVNSPTWSLSIDLAFYCLLPLIASTYLRHPLAGLAIALAVSLVWRAAFIVPDASAPYSSLDFLIQPPLFMADFASGMTAAWAFIRLKQRNWSWLSGRMPVALTAGALVGLVVLAYIGGSNLPYHLGVFQEPAAVRALLPLALLVFAVAVSLSPRWVQWPLTNRGSLWFSEISYSVFLYHFPIIFFGFFTVGISRDESLIWLWVIVVLPASIAIGTLSYFLIEQPSRRWGRRLARRLAQREYRDPVSTGRARKAALGVGHGEQRS